jgi:hypothetical protein
MIPHLVYYQLVILALLWLCLMLPHLWPSPPGGAPKTSTQPIRPKRKRSTEPKPFAGLTHKPHCRMVKKLMRLHVRSISGAPRAVHDTEWDLSVLSLG